MPINTPIYTLPWHKLNGLLSGQPSASSEGGIAAGESMAICGPIRSGRTAACALIAAHFIEVHGLRVALFSSEGVIAGRVAAARRSLPCRASDWDDAQALRIFPMSTVLETAFEEVPDDVGAILVDTAYFSREEMGVLAQRVQQGSRARRIPVFCTVPLSHRVVVDDLACLPTEIICTTADHVVTLDPTTTHRYTVLTLSASRRGICGAVLLDLTTMQEVP